MGKDEKVLKLKVSGITVETPDTKTFRFDLGENKPFDFVPGQFVILSTELWNPKKNRIGPVLRAFSLSSSPLERDWIEITARRYPGGRMTQWLHDTVRVGQAITVKGPQGDFVFDGKESNEVVLVAGGIGVAPYRSIIRYLLETGYEGTVRLIYSARTSGDFAFKAELDRLQSLHPNFRCLYTVTRKDEGWAGRTGRIDRTVFNEALTNTETRYFICGPDAMIREVRELLDSLGVPLHAVRAERW